MSEISQAVSAPARTDEGYRAGARSRIATARLSFDASLPRLGRVMRACRRCFIAGDYAPRTMTELARYAFPTATQLKHWQRWSARRALLALGAEPIGRSATGVGRPGIWSLSAF
jgi:hypothetical protein